MSDPSRIMLSCVFTSYHSKSNSASSASLDQSLESPCEPNGFPYNASSRRKASTMPVPSTSPLSKSGSTNSISSLVGRCDSYLTNNVLSVPYQSYFVTTTGSLVSSPGSLSVPHNMNMKSNSLPQTHRNQQRYLSRAENQDGCLNRIKMHCGFAIIFEPEPSNVGPFQSFFFDHFPLIEVHLKRLKQEIDEDILQLRPTKDIESYKRDFFQSTAKVFSSFKSKIQALYSTPRLPEPIWSKLSCSSICSQERNIVIDCFLGDLSRMVFNFNRSRNNGGFCSSLLTAVLTHHLGWVRTVSKNQVNSNTQDEATSHNHQNNPLCKQIGDLYGAISSPAKLCRTVVTGSNHETVSTILAVLSYFIRCARVETDAQIPEKIAPKSAATARDDPNDVDFNITHVPSAGFDSEEYEFVTFESKTSSRAASRGNVSPPVPVPVPDKLHRANAFKCRPNTRRGGSVSKSTNAVNSTTKSVTIPKKPPRRRSHEVTSAAKRSSAAARGLVRAKSETDAESEVKETGENTSNSEQDNTAALQKETDASATKKCLLATPTHLSRFQPQVERVVNLQSSQPLLEKFPSVISSNFSSKSEDNLKKPVSAEEPISEKPYEITRSTSQPALAASSDIDCSKKIQEETRKKRSSFPIDIPSSYMGGKLVRIPSIEMNHNSFDEYFDISPNETPFIKAGVDSKIPPVEQSCPDTDAKPSTQSEPLHRTHCRSSSGSITWRPQLPPKPTKAAVKTEHVSAAESIVPPPTSSELKKTVRTKPALPLKPPVVHITKCQAGASIAHLGNKTCNNNTKPKLPPKPVSVRQGTLDVVRKTRSVSEHEPDRTSSGVTSERTMSEAQNCKVTPLNGLINRPQTLNLFKISDACFKSPPNRLYPVLPSGSGEVPDTNPTSSVSNSNPMAINSAGKIYPKLPERGPVGPVSQIKPSTSPENLYPSLPESSSLPKDPLEINFSPRSSESDSQDSANKPRIELPLVDFNIESGTGRRRASRIESSDQNDDINTGCSSLMADFSPEYLDDFVLHGVQSSADIHNTIIQNLSDSVVNSPVEEPISESVCILADCDNWSVKVYSSQRLRNPSQVSLPALNSKLVSSILIQVAQMYKMKISPKFCLAHLESELQLLVAKSRMLAEYMKGHKRVTVSQLSAILKIESRDLPLLMAIANCNTTSSNPASTPLQ